MITDSYKITFLFWFKTPELNRKAFIISELRLLGGILGPFRMSSLAKLRVLKTKREP